MLQFWLLCLNLWSIFTWLLCLVWGKGLRLISSHRDTQLSHHHLLKRLAFPPLDCFGIFVKCQMTIWVCIYFWALCSAPFILSILLLHTVLITLCLCNVLICSSCPQNFLYFIYKSLAVMCQDMPFFLFILLGVLWDSWIFKCMSFTKFGNVLALSSSNIISTSFSLVPWTLITCMLEFFILSHRSARLYFFPQYF